MSGLFSKYWYYFEKSPDNNFFCWREGSRHYIFFVKGFLDRNIFKSDQKQIQILSFSGPTLKLFQKKKIATEGIH